MTLFEPEALQPAAPGGPLVRVRVTVSIGVAAHPDLAVENGQQLIGAADEALYEAKRTGRNRVLLKYGVVPPRH